MGHLCYQCVFIYHAISRTDNKTSSFLGSVFLVMENGANFLTFVYLSGHFSVIKCLLGEVDILCVHVRDSEGLKELAE